MRTDHFIVYILDGVADHVDSHVDQVGGGYFKHVLGKRLTVLVDLLVVGGGGREGEREMANRDREREREKQRQRQIERGSKREGEERETYRERERE